MQNDKNKDSVSLKDTNPKDAVGVKKVGLSVLSWPVLFELALAVFEGARKYGKFNWRNVGVRASVYTDACCRHIAAWQEGENIDPESGISHLVKAQACLHILRDAQIRNMMTDDRPPGTIGFVAVQNGMARDLIERHPEAKDPITHKDAPSVEYTNEKVTHNEPTTTDPIAPIRPFWGKGHSKFDPESTDRNRLGKLYDPDKDHELR